MQKVESTVSQLQQLIVEERKNRLSMENRLFAAQDKIGAAECRSVILESKNRQLETEVASWTTDYNEKVIPQPHPVASGSTIPNAAQIADLSDHATGNDGNSFTI